MCSSESKINPDSSVLSRFDTVQGWPMPDAGRRRPRILHSPFIMPGPIWRQTEWPSWRSARGRCGPTLYPRDRFQRDFGFAFHFGSVFLIFRLSLIFGLPLPNPLPAHASEL